MASRSTWPVAFYHPLPPPSWHKLKVLHASDCGLTSLPEGVSELRCLTMVALNNNLLEALPAGVECWENLEKTFLNDNQITVREA